MQNKSKPVSGGSRVSSHFADTFLEAQKLRVTKEGDKTPAPERPSPGLLPTVGSYSTSISSVTTPASPLCIFNNDTCNIFDSTSSATRDLQQAKFGSDRYLTRTYHLQNVATDSQPSIPSSVSDHSSVSRHSEPPVSYKHPPQLDKKRGSTLPPKSSAPAGPLSFKEMDDGWGKSLGKNQSLAIQGGKRKKLFSKDIRRTQSEAQMNKTKSGKPGGGSFGSLKRALSPFIFRKKKTTKQEDDSMGVMKKVSDRDSVHSIPIVMETGFPATSCSDVNREQEDAIMNGSACVRGLVSPLVHPRNTNHLPSVQRNSKVFEESSGSPKRESKLTRKRANLSSSGSPCMSKTSQSSSPAPSLESVRLKNVTRGSVMPKSSTPTKDRDSERRDSGTSSIESVKSKSKSSRSTPNFDHVRQSSNSDCSSRGNSQTVNFSGDISHAKQTLVKPKAIKAYKNPTFTPVKRCTECNNPLNADGKAKVTVTKGVLTENKGRGGYAEGSNIRMESPDITIEAPDITIEAAYNGDVDLDNDLDKTMEEQSTESKQHLRTEMQDLLKRYSPPKQGNYGGATLQRKLKEIKKELEDYRDTAQDNQKIGEIKDKRNSDVLRLSTAGTRNKYSDEVFYKTDEEMFNTTFIKPAEDDYYKEIEVRINPEGIAVVRRRHQLLPESDRAKEGMRRSTIHVDDRVYCDKAVLQSIYGHSPSHVSNKKQPCSSVTDPADKLDPDLKGMKLRSFIHQKSVPNLHETYSDSEDSFTETKKTLVSSARCVETAKLKRGYHRSTVNNLPIHKKYIRAYTKFYEQKLAVKLLDLNRFIQEEKQQRIVLDQRIQKSLLEHEELVRDLNTAKQDILNMIEVIETPV